MVVVEVEAGGVCDAVHVAQDERYGARGRNAGGVHVFVEERKDGGDGILEGGGGVYEAEECARAIGGEVAELQPQERFALGGDFGLWCYGGLV